MPALPSPLPRKTTAELCADTLRRSVLRGDYPLGSRLPPERELAAALGVNRMTLRAALQRLAQEGLLVARQGSGHTVRDAFDTGGPNLVPAILEVMADPATRNTALSDLLATRRALARLVLTRAAATIDALAPDARPAAISPMAEAIDAFERAASAGGDDADVAALSAADRRIVAALLRLTESTTLPLFLNPIAALIANLPELAATLYAEPETNVRGWRAAMTWLGSSPRANADLIESLMLARDEATLLRLAEHTGAQKSKARTKRSTR